MRDRKMGVAAAGNLCDGIAGVRRLRAVFALTGVGLRGLMLLMFQCVARPAMRGHTLCGQYIYNRQAPPAVCKVRRG